MMDIRNNNNVAREPKKAFELWKELIADEDDDFTYIVKHSPVPGGFSIIKAFDEDLNFVGLL